MVNNIATSSHATGFLNIIGSHPECRPAIHSSGRNHSCFTARALRGFNRLRFRLSRHHNNIKHGVRHPRNKAAIRRGFERESAILPGMSARVPKKPRVAIVGAGNLASALAGSLRAAGYRIELIISRKGIRSIRQARRLAREVGASAVTVERAHIQADMVWFCVPDGAIASAAHFLLGAADWKGKIALHSSGALTSDELCVLQERGAAVASVHPLMTFVRGSGPPLSGIPFAIEGDQKAV